MNENKKTAIFVGAAVVLVALAFISRPASLSDIKPADLVGQKLFADFDPLAANSLEILEYDQSTATLRPFEVAQAKGRWSIPSHDEYPADAKDQVAQAATAFVGLKILEVVSEDQGDYSVYGVVDPGEKGLTAGATGVGMRVTMKDKASKDLVAIVIGKQVPDKTNLRYVRKVGDSHVCTVELSTDKLTTKFEDWIEKDLLQLNAWDIKQIEIRDYSVDELNARVQFRGQMSLEYNDTGDPKWKLAKDETFTGSKWTPRKLGDEEELNTSKLDDMKFALDDLKIVDVQPKPKGLSADLKTDKDFASNREALQSLGQRGFHVAQLGNQIELLSNQGEIRTLMKDGVEYLLRFGEVAMGSDSGSDKEKKDAQDKEPEGKDKKRGGLNRYIFVTTQFNPEAIAKPQLEPLPEVPEEKKDEAKKDEKKADQKADEKKDEKKDEAAKPDPKAERERIEKENKRKQDEYDQKVKDGQKRVKELNERFADWYYVISDETYGKIHVNRKDIVKKKEKKDEEKKEEAGLPELPGALKEHVGQDHGHDHGPAHDAKKDAPAAEAKDQPAEKKADDPAAKKSDEKKDADQPKADQKKAEEKKADAGAKKPEADKPAADKAPPAEEKKDAKPAAAEKKPEADKKS